MSLIPISTGQMFNTDHIIGIDKNRDGEYGIIMSNNDVVRVSETDLKTVLAYFHDRDEYEQTKRELAEKAYNSLQYLEDFVRRYARKNYI